MAWIVRGNQREPRCAALGSGRSCEFQDGKARHGMPHGRVGVKGNAIGKFDNRISASGALGAWLSLYKVTCDELLCAFMASRSLTPPPNLSIKISLNTSSFCKRCFESKVPRNQTGLAFCLCVASGMKVE